MQYCFHFGYKKNKGGYATLIICLIRELVKRNEQVVLFNYPDGLIADELGEDMSRVKLLDLSNINWEKIHDHIYPDDVFIIVRFEECFRHLFGINPKMIYYDINDFITRISHYKYDLKFPRLGKRLVKKLISKNSLAFMDDTGMFNLKSEFSIDIENPVFLPIPVTSLGKNEYLIRDNKNKNALRMTYVGRAVDWKMLPLKKILDDCFKVTGQKIEFTIVVDYLEEFKKFIKLEHYQNRNFEIRVVEDLDPSDLIKFLYKNSDIHFGMGTAALDAAKLGIPTVLVNFTSKEIKNDYIYKWLYETKNFNLGVNLEKRNAEVGMGMQEIINVANDEAELIGISQKCFCYVEDYHSSKSIVDQLTTLSEYVQFRFVDAKPFIPYYFRFHSITKKVFKNITHAAQVIGLVGKFPNRILNAQVP